MPKGKFGFSVWLYPFIALWTVLVGPALASVLILGFVALVEKDEWAIQQCIHVVMFSIYWSVYQVIMGFFTGIPLLGTIISIIDGIVFVIMMILVLFLGLGRLKNGRDIGLPGKGIVMRAYGLMQSIPAYQAYQQQPRQERQGYEQQGYGQAPYQEPPYQQPPRRQSQYTEAPPRGYEQEPQDYEKERYRQAPAYQRESAPYAQQARAPEQDNGGGLKPPPPPPSF